MKEREREEKRDCVQFETVLKLFLSFEILQFLIIGDVVVMRNPTAWLFTRFLSHPLSVKIKKERNDVNGLSRVLLNLCRTALTDSPQNPLWTMFSNKCAILGLFFIYFLAFQTNNTKFYNKLMWRIVRPISDTGIQTLDLLIMSLLFQPLDWGFRPLCGQCYKHSYA